MNNVKIGNKVQANGYFDGSSTAWTGTIVKINKKTFIVLVNGESRKCELRVPDVTSLRIWPETYIGTSFGDSIHLIN